MSDDYPLAGIYGDRDEKSRRAKERKSSAPHGPPIAPEGEKTGGQRPIPGGLLGSIGLPATSSSWA